jgi:hypothetical protein
MSVFAEALVDNREYTKVRINGTAVGVANARLWNNAVKNILPHAYAVAEYRYNHMGDSADAAPCDLSDLYASIRALNKLIGEVNGDMLNPVNIAESVVAKAMIFKTKDLTDEMAHARCDLSVARKAKKEDESEENVARYNAAKAEVDRLEALPGNCRQDPTMQSESAFVKAVEIMLGDAIKKQHARPLSEILAEKEAKKNARKAAANKRKAAKKSA